MFVWSLYDHGPARKCLLCDSAVVFVADMATASPLPSEDQFICSICLDVFTEPVSTPCGHNFCKACNAKHWEGKDQCVCPLCNEKFSKGLKLRVNTGYRELVENFKNQHAIADNTSQVKPGQVPCDYCPHYRSKAHKTCLVCLSSYCETHLEPHHRVAVLKGHKLTNPVHNLEEKICKKHNRILEFLCRSDVTRVCVLCTEHSAHDTVPLEEAYVDKRAQMGVKKVQEVQEIKLKRGKRAKKKKKVAEQTTRRGRDEEVSNSEGPNFMQIPFIWFPDEGPHQLNRYYLLPGNMGISGGKFYYEVVTKGRRGWLLGVVRESVLRRQTFTVNSRNGSWIIGLQNNTDCTALHNIPIPLFLTRTPERVRVYVDYKNGLVSFYDEDIPIYTFTGCKFKERIFLFYCLTEDISWTQKLRRNLGDILLGILAMVVLLISFNQSET